MEAKGREGGEVRRVHIIYFLSRMGRIEHPHLIRVHHLSRRGVHLRDVKRWLSELRGKDMPGSFSWSYKRKYKNGHVWQDLMDDDLISPISDNEYVLKGSEISSSPTALIDHYSYVDQKTRDSSSTNPNVQPNPLESDSKQATANLLKMDESPNKASQTTEDGSETSTLTDDSIKSIDQVEMKKTTEIIELGGDDDDDEEEVINNYNKKKDVEEEEEEEEEEVQATMASRSDFSKSRSKSYSSSGGATSVFRNLLSCRSVNATDSVLMSINKTHSPNNASIKNKKKNMRKDENSSEICRVDKLGGSNRIFCGPPNPKHDTSGKSFKMSKEKKVSTPYNTVAEPICSQCGKAFKPEKLHSHMRSCRGLKRASGKATMSPLT